MIFITIYEILIFLHFDQFYKSKGYSKPKIPYNILRIVSIAITVRLKTSSIILSIL